MKEKPEWGPLATFIPNKKLPIYNWFYYKEGFSRDLVLRLIDRFSLKQGDTVLDPFCGVGTTLLACREKGINSTGLDVQPPAVFASLVKTKEYNPDALDGAGKEILKTKFSKPDIGELSPLTKRAFNKHTLDDVIFFREEIRKLENKEMRDLLMLALINVSMKCSYAWKDGAVIKIRKHAVPPLRKLLSRQIKYFKRDLRRLELTDAECDVHFADARRMRLKDESIDSVITSPPYLNKIEYSRIYSIEEELFFRDMNMPSLRSYIGIGISPEKENEEKEKLNHVLDTSVFNAQSLAYFSDMHEVIKELYRVSRKGARLGIVVGNGCFPEGVVDSDVILSRISEHAGFKAKEILVLNKRTCTRNRVEKVGTTRESLLIWEK